VRRSRDSAREWREWSNPGREPLAEASFHNGDKAVVSVEYAKLMIGDRTIATITRGQQLTVLKVEGPWVGALVQTGGQEKKGWVQRTQLATLADKTEAGAVAAMPQAR
jgi:hypothetical protein